MSLESTLGIIMGLLGLVSILVTLTVVFTLQRRDQIQKRQREWIEDLTGRLEYVEPKLKDLVKENRVLRTLMNPTAQLERNHTEVMRILEHQGEMLSQIQEHVEQRPTAS